MSKKVKGFNWRLILPERKCPNCGCILSSFFKGKYVVQKKKSKRYTISAGAEGEDERDDKGDSAVDSDSSDDISSDDTTERFDAPLTEQEFRDEQYD